VGPQLDNLAETDHGTVAILEASDCHNAKWYSFL